MVIDILFYLLGFVVVAIVHEMGHLAYINQYLQIKPPMKLYWSKAGFNVGTSAELNKLSFREYRISAAWGIIAGVVAIVLWSNFMVGVVGLLYFAPYLLMIKRDLIALVYGR